MYVGVLDETGAKVHPRAGIWIWCLVFGDSIGVKPVRFRKAVVFLPFEGAVVRSYPVDAGVNCRVFKQQNFMVALSFFEACFGLQTTLYMRR